MYGCAQLAGGRPASRQVSHRQRACAEGQSAQRAPAETRVRRDHMEYYLRLTSTIALPGGMIGRLVGKRERSRSGDVANGS